MRTTAGAILPQPSGVAVERCVCDTWRSVYCDAGAALAASAARAWTHEERARAAVDFVLHLDPEAARLAGGAIESAG